MGNKSISYILVCLCAIFMVCAGSIPTHPGSPSSYHEFSRETLRKCFCLLYEILQKPYVVRHILFFRNSLWSFLWFFVRVASSNSTKRNEPEQAVTFFFPWIQWQTGSIGITQRQKTLSKYLPMNLILQPVNDTKKWWSNIIILCIVK